VENLKTDVTVDETDRCIFANDDQLLHDAAEQEINATDWIRMRSVIRASVVHRTEPLEFRKYERCNGWVGARGR